MRLPIILFFLFCISSSAFQAQIEKKHQVDELKKLFHQNNRDVDLSARITEHKKWVALGLNVSLGLFGVHRLYLGTSPKVPVIYTFTLGGGGIIFLGDLATIVFTKDLEQFADKPELIMW
jgi:TM2 domain-containing membrane protein YozV